MSISMVYVSCFNGYSISTEINEVQDIEFLSRQIGIKVEKIKRILTENFLPFKITKGVLIFSNRKTACSASAKLESAMRKAVVPEIPKN